MKKTDIVITLIGVLAVVAVVIYVKQQDQPLQGLDLPPETDVQSVTVVPEEPAIRYPVPEPTPPIEPPAAEPETPEQAPPPTEPDAVPEQTEPENPLPTLDESDEALRQDLYILATRQALESLFNLDRIIRRFVVTVDNLPRKHLPRSKYRSNRMVSGRFRVAEDNYGIYLGEENFARYAAFVDLLESMNTDQLVALYLYYYRYKRPTKTWATPRPISTTGWSTSSISCCGRPMSAGGYDWCARGYCTSMPTPNSRRCPPDKRC